MKFIKCIIILFFLAGAIAATAQEFNGGIYGGVAASQLDGDTYKGFNKLGIVGGAYVNRFINKKLAFQLGLRYIEKGSREVTDDHSVNYKCRLHYIELPVTLRYFQYKKLDFEVGLSVGYLLKQYEEIDGYEDPGAPEFNKMELAGLGGLNYALNEKLSVATHFMYSILYVRPHSVYFNSEGKGQHNYLLTLTLAYQLSSWR